MRRDSKASNDEEVFLLLSDFLSLQVSPSFLLNPHHHLFNQLDQLTTGTRRRSSSQQQPLFDSIHHVGLLVSNLEKSLEFYQGVLGLALNSDRPDAKLP